MQDPITLLLIEDDGFLLEMYAQRFAQAGFSVVTKTNPSEALDLLRGGTRVKIIVTDLVMPGMDGFELLRVMRDEGLSKGSTIVVLSNLGEDEDIDRAVKLGAVGYIVKATSTPSEVAKRVVDMHNEAQLRTASSEVN